MKNIKKVICWQVWDRKKNAVDDVCSVIYKSGVKRTYHCTSYEDNNWPDSVCIFIEAYVDNRKQYGDKCVMYRAA